MVVKLPPDVVLHDHPGAPLLDPPRFWPERSEPDVLLTENYQTDTMPLASSGDVLPVGTGQTIGYFAHSIAVRNLGTADVIVNNNAIKLPPSPVGPGTGIVPPGTLAVFTMPGTLHSFYGRPGELVEVTRFRDWQPPLIVQGVGGWFNVDLGVLALSSTVYTTPWALPCTYGGFSARETSETGRFRFRFRDGGPAGPEVETISLSPGESTSDHNVLTKLTLASLYLELVTPNSGTCEMTVRVR
jgi:hypothetical protein